MIHFLVTRSGRHVLDKYLASWGGEFFDRMRVVPYGSLRADARLEPGTWVFSDLERLSPAGRAAAVDLWDRLAREPDRHRLLNHPERSLGRYELLRALRERGTNRYDVLRASEWRGDARFPVFLRRSGDHVGPRTPLLWDAREVEAALAKLRAHHGDLSDWLVIGFADCADDAGYYRKYGAFWVDGVLLPRHVFFSRHWVQKWADLHGGAWADEELAYVRACTHAELLRPVFELARIDYGRIDYSIGKDGLQVWEINTNPIILDPFDREDPTRVPVHEHFAAEWNRVFADLCARSPGAASRRRGAERLAARARVASERWKETRLGRWLRRGKHRWLGTSHERTLRG
jgi:hypothetical protein